MPSLTHQNTGRAQGCSRALQAPHAESVTRSVLQCAGRAPERQGTGLLIRQVWVREPQAANQLKERCRNWQRALSAPRRFSSTAEHPPVQRKAAGSAPASGAKSLSVVQRTRTRRYERRDRGSIPRGGSSMLRSTRPGDDASLLRRSRLVRVQRPQTATRTVRLQVRSAGFQPAQAGSIPARCTRRSRGARLLRRRRQRRASLVRTTARRTFGAKLQFPLRSSVGRAPG